MERIQAEERAFRRCSSGMCGRSLICRKYQLLLGKYCFSCVLLSLLAGHLITCLSKLIVEVHT